MFEVYGNEKAFGWYTSSCSFCTDCIPRITDVKYFKLYSDFRGDTGNNRTCPKCGKKEVWTPVLENKDEFVVAVIEEIDSEA